MVNKETVREALNNLSDDELVLLLNKLKEEVNTDEEFEDPIQTARGGKVKANERPNKFLDMKFNRKEKRELEEAKEVDKILLKDHVMTPRERESTTFVQVSCSVCGKQDNVSLALIHNVERYRCNDCYKGK
jgi:hypothetical protein